MHYFLYVFALGLSFLNFKGRSYEEDVVHNLKYDIIKSGKIVGAMNASMKKSNAGIEYITESKISMSMVLSVDVYNKVSGFFVNGELQRGGIMRKVNGKIKADTQIAWSDGRYTITEPANTTSLAVKIGYTTACLMYIEPVNNKEVFSEVFKKFLSIKKLTEHRYALQLPDGYENIYTYKDGHCVEAYIKSSMADLTIRLRK